MSQAPLALKDFALRVLVTVGIVSAAVVLLLVAWNAADMLLLVFAGILLAVLLRGVSDRLSRHAPLSPRWSLGVIVTLFIGLSVLGVWLLGPGVSDGIEELIDTLPKTLQQLGQQLGDYDWGQRLLRRLRSATWMSLTPDSLARITRIFSTTLGIVVSLLVILFMGLYFSAQPGLYVETVLRLVPPARRDRARAVFIELGNVLWWWMLGRMAIALIDGALIWAGLRLLGIPLAFTLGLLTAVLSFVPNIGPVLSAIPAVLLGLAQGPMMALYVVLLYVAVQTIETYGMTPFIQQRTVGMPPAFLLTLQLVMGVALGALGLLLAVPLGLVAMVLLQRLYVEPALGEHIELS